MKDFERKLRVIILAEDDQSEIEQKKFKGRKLQAMSVRTKGLVFDRDEANERWWANFSSVGGFYDIYCWDYRFKHDFLHRSSRVFLRHANAEKMYRGT